MARIDPKVFGIIAATGIALAIIVSFLVFAFTPVCETRVLVRPEKMMDYGMKLAKGVKPGPEYFEEVTECRYRL